MLRLALLGCVLFVTLITGGCGTRSDDLATLQSQGTIRIGTRADSPPFGSQVGSIRMGFDIDVATAVAQRLGLEPIFVDVTSANRIEKLHNGDVDMLIAATTITRSREKLIDFSIPYFQDGQSLLVKVASPITNYQTLAGRRVGAVQGSTSASNLRQVAPDAVLVEFADFKTLFDALASDSIEAITSDRLMLMGLVRQRKITGVYRLAGKPFSTEPYGIAMRQNQSTLRTAVNHALLSLWEDGTWQQIRDTWFGPGTPYATDIHFSIVPYPR